MFFKYRTILVFVPNLKRLIYLRLSRFERYGIGPQF